MRHFIQCLLCASAMLCAVAASASAATANTPCAAEHQNVKAACQLDRCSQQCKDAHKAMKACRIANNLPMHAHTGGGIAKEKCPSASETGSPGATATPAPSAQ